MTSPVVTVTEGQLQGCEKTNLDGDKFYSFLGIPFAKPPVGELRFKAPEPAEPWTGIRDATLDGDACYQSHDYFGHIEGSEDCLHLNVFTKTLPQDTGDLNPVLVWIYGGSFITGNNNSQFHGPEFLMTQDIVLVSVNYRVGFLGFLQLDDSSLNVPGNAGIKDQQLALKWIQKNIKNFNGDAGNVTIFGQSAGSVSVHYHMVSRLSKGLFHKAVLQSGCLLNHWALSKNYSMKFAKTIKQSVTTEKEAFEVLRSTPVEQLFIAQEAVFKSLGGIGAIGPTIEKPNPTAVITCSPLELLLSDQYNKVPILIGYCNREGLIGEVLSKSELETGVKHYENFLKVNPGTVLSLIVNKDDDECKLVLKKIVDTYFQGSFAADKYLLATDYYFVAGVIAAAKLHAKTSPYPVYLYRVSLDAGLNLFKRILGVTTPGVCHADELGYLFNTQQAADFLDKGETEEIAIRRFVTLWTNFAKTGDPTPKGNNLIDLMWKPVNDEELNYLDIGTELTLQTNPEPERWKVWKEIYQLTSATEILL